VTTNHGTRTDRRALLISAARELFTERAYDEVTTTEIAKRAGVAYGLIAHHFTNKRGIYLATVRAAADQLRAVRDAQPRGDTHLERLRDAITRHISYVDANAAEFRALMHGGSGSDAEVRAIIDELRWESAQFVLHALGVVDPVPPILRASMHGWVGYLYELTIDRLNYHDVAKNQLVELATATLVTALLTAGSLEPAAGLSAEVLDELVDVRGAP
jgi:AcrR family transcriptional regulator